VDLLMSADMLVPDATTALDALVTSLGVPQPKPSWRQLWDGFGFDAFWCRLDPDLTSAPTRLEIISPAEPPDPALDHPHMAAIFDAHGDRPAKAHSTPISVPAVETLVERLARRGARFRLDPPIPELPIPRLWIGVTADEPARYLPESDAGLRLEFLPTVGLMLPPGTQQGRVPVRTGDGRFTRVLARLFVTHDLAATRRTLAENFDWQPDHVMATPDGERARFGFDFELSGWIEVVQPAAGAYEVAFIDRWGSGPYGIRLAVDGLQAKAADLRRRGTRFEQVERADLGVALWVDPIQTAGTQFEIVEDPLG
jgi:hypothetical protein